FLIYVTLAHRSHSSRCPLCFFSFFFTAPAPSEIYTLSLHDALPISEYRLLLMLAENAGVVLGRERLLEEVWGYVWAEYDAGVLRSEEHTSELQSRENLVCRLLLEKKKKKKKK